MKVLEEGWDSEVFAQFLAFLNLPVFYLSLYQVLMPISYKVYNISWFNIMLTIFNKFAYEISS